MKILVLLVLLQPYPYVPYRTDPRAPVEQIAPEDYPIEPAPFSSYINMQHACIAFVLASITTAWVYWDQKRAERKAG